MYAYFYVYFILLSMQTHTYIGLKFELMLMFKTITRKKDMQMNSHLISQYWPHIANSTKKLKLNKLFTMNTCVFLYRSIPSTLGIK